jgi:hypothetical protein
LKGQKTVLLLLRHDRPIDIMRRWKTLLLGALTAATLAACTATTIAYNNAPTAITYVADDWFDLTPAQREWLKPRVEKLLAWHRANELPQYRQLIARAAERANGDVSVEEVNALYAESRRAVERMVETALPDMVGFLQQVDATQIEFLSRKFAKDNDKLAKEMKVSIEERRENRVKRYVERYESWMGTLSATQRDMIRTTVEALPFNEEARLADRRRWQGEFIAMLKSKPDAATLTREVRVLMLTPELRRDAAYQARWTAQQKTLTALTSQLMATATPDQRRAVQRKLNGYANDVSALLKS